MANKELSESDKSEIMELLKQAEEPNVADRLTEWEQNFLASVSEQFEKVGWLSPDKQIPKLKEIVEGKPDGRSSGRGRGANSRPKKVSYGSSDAAERPRGRFTGFAGSGSED